MNKILAIAKREFASYFHSWIGVLTGVMFLLISGVFFVVLVLNYVKISMNPQQFGLSNFSGISQTQFVFGSFFTNLNVLLLFMVPILTMRSFAEERRQETLEILFTYPLSDFEIVIGKQLGIIWFFEVLMLPLLGYMAVFYWIGGQFDWGPTLLGFLGFWFLGMAYLAAGVFISTLTKHPVVSALGTFSILVLFWIFEWVAGITDGIWGRIFSELSPLDHYKNFSVGILSLQDLVYFLFFFFYFLFLTLRSIETRHWKTS
ncbi:MAG TPA: ABC transporter permease subunit [Candidatus Omnitrophota bacterium]|nr:ABC transporter permease subunit [Candidatus Omnitrophota bacterium]